MREAGVHAPTAARYVLSLCQRLGDKDPGDLLTGTGLTPEILQAPGQFVSHDALDRFLLNVEQYTHERLPGIRLGHHLNISAHGAAGYAGLTTANAGMAIQIAIRYFPLITSLATLSIRQSGNRTELLIHPTPGISERAERFVVHTLLASFDVMGNFLVGNLALRATLAFADQPDLRDRLGPAIGNIAFDQAYHGFSIPRDRLETPFALADRSAHEQALAQCEREMAALEGQKSMAGRVLSLLANTDGPPPDQETIANKFGMSSRTLHRQLLNEGASFRELLRQARLTQAKHCLLHQRLSVTETAYRLGYQDSANFTRAFRQATGMSPSEYLRHCDV